MRAVSYFTSLHVQFAVDSSSVFIVLFLYGDDNI